VAVTKERRKDFSSPGYISFTESTLPYFSLKYLFSRGAIIGFSAFILIVFGSGTKINISVQRSDKALSGWWTCHARPNEATYQIYISYAINHQPNHSIALIEKSTKGLQKVSLHT